MITGVCWYNGRDCIGIVQVVQDHELESYRLTNRANFKYYIGTADGYNEQADMKRIAEWGAQFDTSAGDLLFNVNKI